MLLDIFRPQDIVDVAVTVIFLRGSRICDPPSIDNKLEWKFGSARSGL
jgi:hypothetical protein